MLVCHHSSFIEIMVVKCIIKQQECKGEEQYFLGHLGVVLYEYLGEEYSKVLGIKMTPPIKE
ncbi:splicing factor, putative [Medicago truncatula]|uniref:Splicing factor, putative n=1 Tax=Medicago truncatula TaxID=3880 RepID=G7L2W5_MEDTR|nr:splicing factor, putative [Medicago truncatula]